MPLLWWWCEVAPLMRKLRARGDVRFTDAATFEFRASDGRTLGPQEIALVGKVLGLKRLLTRVERQLLNGQPHPSGLAQADVVALVERLVDGVDRANGNKLETLAQFHFVACVEFGASLATGWTQSAVGPEAFAMAALTMFNIGCPRYCGRLVVADMQDAIAAWQEGKRHWPVVRDLLQKLGLSPPIRKSLIDTYGQLCRDVLSVQGPANPAFVLMLSTIAALPPSPEDELASAEALVRELEEWRGEIDGKIGAARTRLEAARSSSRLPKSTAQSSRLSESPVTEPSRDAALPARPAGGTR